MSEQPTIERLVREGGTALRGGDRERARQLLAQAVRSDPRNEQAWLLLAGAVSDRAQRRSCLERVLRLNPEHPLARRALAALATEAAAPVEAPLAPPAAQEALQTPAQAPMPAPLEAAPEEPPAAPTTPARQDANAVLAILQNGPSLFGPAPSGPALAPARLPSAPAAPVPAATSTTERLPPLPSTATGSAVSAGARTRLSVDRLTWSLVLALGLVLMLTSLAFAVFLLN